ncbi:MAG: serine/threonine-protein phosphatase, partial [Bacteroidetes bacterium]|nr:serine/threonine-protein phosphatase [Bacteroidota bacterium]
KKIESPAQILHYMNLAVIEILNQQGLQTQDDGMDMTIARIETDSGKLNVATANQEALLFRNGACETVPAGNFSVGGFLSARKTAVYNDLQYSLCPEDSFYMFSDGLIDQFGGDGNEKFSLNRFREIISGMYTEPAGKQEAVLAGKLDAWMNPAPGVNIPQLDDILVIGISFRIQ